MDSLSEQLKALGVNLGAQNIPSQVTKNRFPIQDAVSGRFISNLFGDVFCVEEVYQPEYLHGSSSLKMDHPLNIMAEWSHADCLAETDLENLIFLDTETTGLSGGTGTFAFLVGLGRFSGNDFKLTQFFLRDPSEENSLLAAISEYCDSGTTVVTYNGKSFDIPLLSTRYTLQAISSPFLKMSHLDLLPLARRLWRDRLPSRSLGYIEKEILGAARTQDEVPGWMIPQLYFDYMRSGDSRPLAGVFYHNAMDILSLAALLKHTNFMISEPLSLIDQPGIDVIAIGKLYEDLGYRDTAIQLYEKGLGMGLPEEFYLRTIERFANLYKQERKWDPALDLWQKAADRGELYAFIELAKYYEHIARNPREAFSWTRSAIDRLNSGNYPRYFRQQLLPELEHRLKRLQPKNLT
jgi:uncharacterized protein